MNIPEASGMEKSHELMMRAIDGEISPEDRREFDHLIATDARFKEEWTRLKDAKEVTRNMEFQKPPEESWNRLRDQVMGQRNWIQKLGRWIPGFGGYHDREDRREADRLLREAVATRLNRGVESLGRLSVDLVKRKDLDGIERIQRLSRKTASFSDRIRTATYGYSGFFDAVKIREGELDTIHTQDARLLENAEGFGTEAAALDPAVLALDAIERRLGDMEAAFERRREILLKL